MKARGRCEYDFHVARGHGHLVPDHEAIEAAKEVNRREAVHRRLSRSYAACTPSRGNVTTAADGWYR